MRRRGFTLMEVLVSTVLAAMLALLAAHVFSAAASTRTRVAEAESEIGAFRRAYDVISRDMHSATVFPEDSGLQFGLTMGDPGTGSSVLQLASAIGEPLLAQRLASETVLVQYAVVQDPESGKPGLWRFETPYPFPDNVGAQPTQENPGQLLVPDVVGVTYLFYSRDQATWIEGWDDQTGMPSAVRMDLVLQDPDRPNDLEARRQQSWIFQLPAAAYLSEQATQAAEAAASGTGSGAAASGSGGAQ